MMGGLHIAVAYLVLGLDAANAVACVAFVVGAKLAKKSLPSEEGPSVDSSGIVHNLRFALLDPGWLQFYFEFQANTLHVDLF